MFLTFSTHTLRNTKKKSKIIIISFNLLFLTILSINFHRGSNQQQFYYNHDTLVNTHNSKKGFDIEIQHKYIYYISKKKKYHKFDTRVHKFDYFTIFVNLMAFIVFNIHWYLNFLFLPFSIYSCWGVIFCWCENRIGNYFRNHRSCTCNHTQDKYFP